MLLHVDFMGEGWANQGPLKDGGARAIGPSTPNNFLFVPVFSLQFLIFLLIIVFFLIMVPHGDLEN